MTVRNRQDDQLRSLKAEQGGPIEALVLTRRAALEGATVLATPLLLAEVAAGTADAQTLGVQPAAAAPAMPFWLT